MVASRFDNQITWFRNLAGAAFSVGGSIDIAEPTDVALVDVDGDKDLDVLYTSFVYGELPQFRYFLAEHVEDRNSTNSN